MSVCPIVICSKTDLLSCKSSNFSIKSSKFDGFSTNELKYDVRVLLTVTGLTGECGVCELFELVLVEDPIRKKDKKYSPKIIFELNKLNKPVQIRSVVCKMKNLPFLISFFDLIFRPFWFVIRLHHVFPAREC